MKKLGLFIIVGLLSMTIPQMNANTFTVQAATIKKVTSIKKNRVKDGSYFYSKKKYYDGCYRKISWKKIKKVSGYQVYRYDYYLKKWNRVLTTKNNYFKITDMCEGQKIKITNTCNKKNLLLATSVWGCYPESIIVKTIFNSYKVNIYFKDWYYGETNWKMDKFDCNVFIVGKDMETKSNRYIYIHEIELEGENSPIELKLPYNPDIFIFALSCE